MTDLADKLLVDLQKAGVLEKFASIKKEDVLTSKYLAENVQKIVIGDNMPRCILKQSCNQHGIASITASKMYKKIGILTPQTYMVNSREKYYTKTIQQDVSTLDGLVSVLAGQDLKYSQIRNKVFGKYKWQMFYDISLEEEFLQYMTPDCLEALQNIFLVDELCTDGDRHIKNYFFYRHTNSDRYEGVIAIDLDIMAIFNYCGKHKYEFESFIATPYSSATPQQVNDNTCYLNRVKNLQTLIQDGVLSNGNIQAMKMALSYDLPAQIKSTCQARKLRRGETNRMVIPLQRLWEYNSQTVGRELGM